ncbi:GGDEF domain-containing protein [Agitococcus lubricus]|uniref:diguanylate cyclase n=1 Tax=Agitococcus lubricus TaxID=1077255 RepID=A0A2T5IZ32_9GAMM|nr:diguanylate cyclase [Agitococcus lubricus]PTQ89303.1 diguanylate cyclase (GGDEF)-like protein [Agitococcus lubricus]
MQVGDNTAPATSLPHPIAALSQEPLAQERTAIIELLNDNGRLRGALPHNMEKDYRQLVIQRAISVMQANRWTTILFYLFIGLITYQQVHYVANPAYLQQEMMIWLAIYLMGGGVFAAIGALVYNPKLDRYYSYYMGTASFLGLCGMIVASSAFHSPYINQQASYLVIFIYMLVYSLASLRLVVASLIGIFASFLALAVITTFHLPVDFGQYAQYTGLSNVIGFVIAFMIDQRDRRAFLQARLIDIEKQQLNQLSQEMARISQEDGLTGLANRRHFNETLAREWAIAEREQYPVSLMFIDVDHFKPYNDTYGHLEGDKTLSRVGRTLKKMAKRPADLAARYGGEEFVLLLPKTDIDGAYVLAQEVQAAIDALAIPHKSSKAGKYVSVSIGLSCVIPNDNNSITTLIDQADEGVYAAKKAGRHRIRIFPVPDVMPVRKEINTDGLKENKGI